MGNNQLWWIRPKYDVFSEEERFGQSYIVEPQEHEYPEVDYDYCKCEYSVYSESLDYSAPMYCTRCGKVITIYNPIVSEERARQLEERARLEKLSSSLRSK